MKRNEIDLSAALNRAAGGTTSNGPAPTAAADRKVLLVRLDPDTMRRLKHLAVDRDSTLQALAAEAIELLFERYEGLRPDRGRRRRKWRARIDPERFYEGGEG